MGAPVAPGAVHRRGARGVYRKLVPRASRARIVRQELSGISRPVRKRRSLLHVAQMTDLHVLDPSSPARYEFMQRFHHLPGMKALLPAHRPHEVLLPHALDAMIRSVNQLPPGTETGAPVQMALVTGDMVDNAQENELMRFLDIIDGGRIEQPPYEGVASAEWEDEEYWHPDPVADVYKDAWGFPTVPDLLDRASAPFQAEGLVLPWLALPGNHDSLVMGTASPSEEYGKLVVGDRKAAAFPPDAPVDVEVTLPTFLTQPEALLTGPARPVTPDPARRLLTPQTLVSSFPSGRVSAGRPLPGGSYCSVYDGIDGVRLVMLDTNNRAGYHQGSLNRTQYAWLHNVLAEVHSWYYTRSGRRIRTSHSDRLVVIVSHHELETLTNLRTSEQYPEERVGAAEVEELVHRFPNVVLWLNGHTHRNRIRPRPDPLGRTPGFWEVTTSSLIDWPCQGRTIEITDNRDGTISILTDPVDLLAPADPREASGSQYLASLYRELAANDPHAGLTSGLAGTPADSTADLRLPAPFRLG